MMIICNRCGTDFDLNVRWTLCPHAKLPAYKIKQTNYPTFAAAYGAKPHISFTARCIAFVEQVVETVKLLLFRGDAWVGRVVSYPRGWCTEERRSRDEGCNK